LNEPKSMIPASPHCIARRGDETKLGSEWNPVVSEYFWNEDWEER